MKSVIALLLVLFATPLFAAQSVVIVLDDSGSMGYSLRESSGTRIEAARTALRQVISELPDGTDLGIVTLNGNWDPTQWVIPLDKLNKTDAIRKIDSIQPTNGTPLGGCMKAGMDALLALRDKKKYGNYRLLVVSDGEENGSVRVATYLPDMLSRGVVIDVIGVDMDKDHSLATKVNHYRRAIDQESLTEAIGATFAEVPANDTANEDFLMVSAIPDEMAPKVLAALQVSDNKPIGAKQEIIKDNQGNVVFDSSGNIQIAVPASSHTWIWITVAIVAGFLLIVFFAVVCSS